MEINVLENKKNKLVFELSGAGHTFCNALKEELRSNDSVSLTTYNISHPLVGRPKFFVETKGNEAPKKALEKAITGLKTKNTQFLKEYKSMK